MNRRQRKKLLLGEFQEWLFVVCFRYEPAQVDSDALWDRFIEEAIEGNNLNCGGAGGNGQDELIVSFYGWPGTNERETAWHRVQEWLKEYQRNVPVKFEVGPLTVDLGKAALHAPRAAQRQVYINRRLSIPVLWKHGMIE